MPENPTSVGSDHHTASSRQPLALSHAHLWALKLSGDKTTRKKFQLSGEVGAAAPDLHPTVGSSHPARSQPGTISSGRAHQCRVWFLVTITSKTKSWGLSCWWCSHRRCHRELSVLWLMGHQRGGLQQHRDWKHPVVSGCLEEQWGNNAALPPSCLSGASGSCESCPSFSEQLPIVQPHHPKVFGEQSRSAWSVSTSSAVQGPGS